MGKFGLSSVESTNEKPKKEATPKAKNLIEGHVNITLDYVNLPNENVVRISDKSFNLSASDRVYKIGTSDVIMNPMKDGELLRQTYCLYKNSLKVKGYIVKEEFNITHIIYHGKTVKLKL